MFFYRLAEYVMRGQKEALLLTALFALVPFLRWLALSIVILVTLRQGVQRSFLLFVAVLVFFSLHKWWAPGLWDPGILLASVVIWIAAILLRSTRDWTRVLIFISVLCVLMVPVFHETLTLQWQADLPEKLAKASELKRQQLQFFSHFVTSLNILGWQIFGLLSLVFARMMQAMLYNPGGLRKELHFLRLPAWFATAVLFAAGAILYLRLPLYVDMLPLLILPLFVAGLSMLHYFAYARRAGWVLWVYYTSFLWLPLYYSVALVLILAAADSFFDLRKRIQYRV